MTLRKRLARLEGAQSGGNGDIERDAADFQARIGRMIDAVLLSGELAHSLNASPAQNYAKALLRGDDEMARGILRNAGLGEA